MSIELGNGSIASAERIGAASPTRAPARAPAPARTRPRRAASPLKRFYSVIATVVVLLIWQGGVRLFAVPALILPAPSTILATLWVRRSLYLAFSIPTTVEILVGFFIAAIAGIFLGMLVSFSSFARSTFYPMLISSQLVPKVAIAPVLIIWFGTGLEAKAFIVFLIAFFPIMISTMVGLEVVEADMLKLFHSMGASSTTTFLKLRLPAALPNIFAGMKIGMSLAVVGAIVAEFVAADRGLGYYLLYANGQLDSPGVFGALVLLTVIGVVLYYIVEWSQRLFIPAALIKSADPTQASM
ncbi:MAG TPA: ABC transporter permease [Acetobacteraceae bacterium]|nr:ABC transporter permease [Acetobacteraceae bacterium]